MRYTEVEKTIRDLAAAADAGRLRQLGAATVVRLTSDPDVIDRASIEFDEDGYGAFVEACADPAGSTVERLRAWVTRIDEGTVSDGDMDPQVLSAITALDRWGDYLAGEDPDAVADLALLLLEEVDYLVSGNQEDFLAPPEIAAEYARITGQLTA